MYGRWIVTLVFGLALAGLTLTGARAAELNDDGLHTQPWFKDSFLEMAADLEEAAEEGRRLVVVFEQKGCIYCEKVHKTVLSDPWFSDYVTEHYDVVQLNLFGERLVVDFDGEEMPERQIARRWGIIGTPTFVFFPVEYDEDSGQHGGELALEKMAGAWGRYTYRDLFQWIAEDAMAEEPSFPKYHNAKMRERLSN